MRKKSLKSLAEISFFPSYCTGQVAHGGQKNEDKDVGNYGAILNALRPMIRLKPQFGERRDK